jgi:hypothetical protein
MGGFRVNRQVVGLTVVGDEQGLPPVGTGPGDRDSTSGVRVIRPMGAPWGRVRVWLADPPALVAQWQTPGSTGR